MKTKSSTFLMLVLLAVLSASGASLAQGGPARREVQAYYQANILPTVQQQRQKLEPQAASADRAQARQLSHPGSKP
ncbi:hypothetical protein ACFQT0_23135 [Hymenobacter humi]|uniref:Uncharacterized protein n=1 Tax=Hymenobacter humi TaxID=1411620 RepID=A0ABW2U8X5_9BACT